MNAALAAFDVLTRHRSAVEQALQRLFDDVRDHDKGVRAAMRHAVLSPGKRIRPVMTLLCAEHLGAPLHSAIGPACALELVHAASLALDDMPCMDDAQQRRGRPALHVAFGQDTAALAVVSLLAEAYALMANTPDVPDPCRVSLVSLLSRTIGMQGLAGGQEIDLRRERLDACRTADMHWRKTCALFVAAAEVAGLVADANSMQRAVLQRFAHQLGLAFQEMDDLTDAHTGHAEAGNVVFVLGREATRLSADRRLREAREALREAGAPAFSPLGVLVDYLAMQIPESAA